MRKTFSFCLILLTSTLTFSQKKGVETTYYDDGKTIRTQWEYYTANESTIKNITTRDSKTGQYTGYDKGGYSVGQKVPHGKWKEYYKNGQLQTVYTYVNGYREGEVKGYYPTGELVEEYSFHDNLIDGELIEYYKTGEIYLKCPYVNGKREGKATIYNKDGSILYEIIYDKTDKPGYETHVAIGKATKFHPNGKKAEYGTVKSIFDGVTAYSTVYDGYFEYGEWEYYNESGILIAKVNYDKGVRVGETKTYFPNGNIKELRTYAISDVEGYGSTSVINGPFMAYYENGNLKEKGVVRTLINEDESSESGIKKTYYNDGAFFYYDQNGHLNGFSIFEKSKPIIELDKTGIQNQLNINEELDTEELRSRLMDKYTIYIKLHYNDLIEDYTNCVLESSFARESPCGDKRHIYKEIIPLIEYMVDLIKEAESKSEILMINSNIEKIFNWLYENKNSSGELHNFKNLLPAGGTKNPEKQIDEILSHID